MSIYLLALETSSTNCSVAISKDGVIIGSKEINDNKYSHSENLHLFIQDLLIALNVSVNDLSAIVLGKGPGSYTGLRIGTATAKGLSFSLQIPLISVCSLKALALKGFSSYNEKKSLENFFIVPMADARRMEVYTAIITPLGVYHTPPTNLVLTSDSYLELLNTHTLLFVGDGASKFQKICSHPNALFLSDEVYYPSAMKCLDLAWDKFLKEDFEDLAYFEPFYLKKFKTNF